MSHSIRLEACLATRKINRFFYIQFGHNLFGNPFIQVNNGRIGSRGRIRELMFNNDDDCHKKLREMVRKRLNAQKRLGVNYQIKYTTLKAEQLHSLTEPKKQSRKLG